MREFKEIFERLGYTFQSTDVLEDVYLFYKYYNNSANKGVSSILLEGDPGCGKTYLSETFSKFLGPDTEYLYTQCVEETNSDRLIATYNVPAIVKGDADQSIAEGILTRAIKYANAGKKVVLTIDELDKAREVLDSYFLDFLQSGKIETSNNEILSLTEEGRKKLYVILAKNNERELSDPLLRRCSVIKLPPMPPVLAYKTLLKRFEDKPHDPKFLKFISKVYEAIYNEQRNHNNELLSRLPALQELITAITSDNELYENGISSTRRIKNLIRKLGKEDESRDIVTQILINKFKYQNQESNYEEEQLDIIMNQPADYMSQPSQSNSLIEQYIKDRESGEYVFEEEEFDDPMRDIASILDHIKDDQSLVFLDEQNKEKIVELGIITHKDPTALDVLFEKIRFKGNPNSRFSFLSFEDNNFIGLMKYRHTLILVANKEFISPRLFMKGLSSIISIIYDINENIGLKNNYFSEWQAKDFQLTGLKAKVLSTAPKFVIDKMKVQNGVKIFQTNNLKITYDDTLAFSYFEYLQKYRAQPLFEVIKNICQFNPELALPVSYISAKKFHPDDYKIVDEVSKFELLKLEAEQMKLNGWEVKIGDFVPMKITTCEPNENDFSLHTGNYVFKCMSKIDPNNKKAYFYPKYKVKNGFLLYTEDEDFENDAVFQQLNPFQKEIAYLARKIYGNFVLQSLNENKKYSEYFSYLTMLLNGKDENAVENNDTLYYYKQIFDNYYNIIPEPEFKNYYDAISQPSTVITPNKVLTRNLKQ